MSEELKPCPFCGSIDVANMYRADGTIFGIGCKSCHASMIGDRGTWNTRHESKPLTVDNPAIRHIIGGIPMTDDAHGDDNLSIALATYFETRLDCPDEESDELGWKPWAIDNTNKVLDKIIHAALPSEAEKDRMIAELTADRDRWMEANGANTVSLHHCYVEIDQTKAAYKSMREALETIKDRPWLENALDPQWPAMVATRTLTQYPEVK